MNTGNSVNKGLLDIFTVVFVWQTHLEDINFKICLLCSIIKLISPSGVGEN